MRMNTGLMDLWRRFTAPTGIQDIYQTINNDAATIGLARVALAVGRVPADYIFLQASLANAGVICVGGVNVTTVNGVELDAGRAIAFSPVSPLQPGSLARGLMTGSLTAGVLRNVESLDYSELRELQSQAPAGARIVLDLSHFYAVADIAGQTLRIAWVIAGRV